MLPNHFADKLTYVRVPVQDSLATDIGLHFDNACDFIRDALAHPSSCVLVREACRARTREESEKRGFFERKWVSSYEPNKISLVPSATPILLTLDRFIASKA